MKFSRELLRSELLNDPLLSNIGTLPVGFERELGRAERTQKR